MSNDNKKYLKVDVYFNLRKKCFSVRHKGKVVLHTQTICVKDAKLIVSEKGRQRVVFERRKNVHAFVRGYWTDETLDDYQDNDFSPLTYNPYERGEFYNPLNDATVKQSPLIVGSVLNGKGKLAYV